MSDSLTDTQSSEPDWDPLFLHSRREAIFIFLVWLAGLLWAVPFCYFNGYLGRVEASEITTIWGIPSWLFWGIAVPWVVADVITIWFCFGFMQLDDLGETAEDDGNSGPGGADGPQPSPPQPAAKTATKTTTAAKTPEPGRGV